MRERQFNKDNDRLFNWYNVVMRNSTQQRIIEHLRVQRVTSTRELSRVFGMTRANIRHHLLALETDKVVEVIGERREGKGRPENIYGLASAMLENGLDRLASALLESLCVEQNEGKVEHQLRSVARFLSSDMLVNRADQLPMRLNEAVGFLNLRHYHARWEASARGARLILGQCPFASIISSHPELCRLDALLLEEWIGSKVIQVQKLERVATGATQCAFLMS
jgi:predicted ArsR family transcriptional regulator